MQGELSLLLGEEGQAPGGGVSMGPGGQGQCGCAAGQGREGGWLPELAATLRSEVCAGARGSLGGGGGGYSPARVQGSFCRLCALFEGLHGGFHSISCGLEWVSPT